MLKLIYNLKVGFNDCYVTLIDDEFELSGLLASQNELIEELGTISESEEDFYNRYKDNIEQLLDDMNDNGWGLIWDETTRLNYTKLFFSHIVGNPISYVASIWEPSKVRLVYDPNVRTSYYYNNALSAKETCELLKISKQQLHYYVKTGQIKKEFNPDKDFVGGVISNTKNDEDRQNIIDYIQNGDDVTAENVILLSLHLKQEHEKIDKD